LKKVPAIKFKIIY